MIRIKNEIEAAIVVLENQKPGIAGKIIFTDGDVCDVIDMAIRVLKRQIPQETRLLYEDFRLCPMCKGKVERNDRYCRYCGQAINGDNE